MLQAPQSPLASMSPSELNPISALWKLHQGLPLMPAVHTAKKTVSQGPANWYGPSSNTVPFSTLVYSGDLPCIQASLQELMVSPQGLVQAPFFPGSWADAGLSEALVAWVSHSHFSWVYFPSKDLLRIQVYTPTVSLYFKFCPVTRGRFKWATQFMANLEQDLVAHWGSPDKSPQFWPIYCSLGRHSGAEAWGHEGASPEWPPSIVRDHPEAKDQTMTS